MTFLKTIVESEKAAQKLKDDAQKEASLKIEQTEEAQKISLAEMHETLKLERTDEINKQKDDLAQIYRNIIAEGKKQATKIQDQAHKKQEAAIKKILETLKK